MKCMRCGRENPRGATCCVYCNAPFTRRVVQKQAPEKPSMNKGILAAIIILCVVLAFIVGMLIYGELAPGRGGFTGRGGGGDVPSNSDTTPAGDESPDWKAQLTEGYWFMYSSGGAPFYYKFNADGTFEEIALEERADGNYADVPAEDMHPTAHGANYEIVDDVLRMYGDGFEFKLKWVTKADNYNWDEKVKADLPMTGGFFYEYEYVAGDPEDSAFYLRRPTSGNGTTTDDNKPDEGKKTNDPMDILPDIQEQQSEGDEDSDSAPSGSNYDWKAELTKGYWMNNIKCPVFHKFNADGTIYSYTAEPRADGDYSKVTEDDLISFGYIAYDYVIKGDVLRIYSDGEEPENTEYCNDLKWVTLNDNCVWDNGIKHDLPTEGGFFYEYEYTGVFEENEMPVNAFYLRRP